MAISMAEFEASNEVVLLPPGSQRVAGGIWTVGANAPGRRPLVFGLWTATRRPPTIWPRRCSWPPTRTWRRAAARPACGVGCWASPATWRSSMSAAKPAPGEERGPLATKMAQWRMEQLEQDSEEEEEHERMLAACEVASVLAAESRRVVEEHHFQHQSGEAIAPQQGRTAGSVRMMLLRVRKGASEVMRKKLKARTTS